MGTAQSRRHSMGEDYVSPSPSKDSSFFDLTFGKSRKNYSRHNSTSEDDSRASHKHKKHFLDLNSIIGHHPFRTGYRGDGPANADDSLSLSPQAAGDSYHRPRSKTISQANPITDRRSNRREPSGPNSPPAKGGRRSGPRLLPTVFRWETLVDGAAAAVKASHMVIGHRNSSGTSSVTSSQLHPPKAVYLSGSWDGWKTKIPLVHSQGDFTTIIEIPEGRYEYKFLVDNKWEHNNHMPTVDNGIGTRNNVINVKKSDFEVFDALADDFADTESSYRHSSDSSTNVDGSGNHFASDSGYCQDIPSMRILMEWDRLFGVRGGTSAAVTAKSVANATASSGPPFLPPQLLQVLLNKDIPYNYEPELLPEPNHVMINHLYALSIKDGVMVLSCTHRHHKKYVTTLLYKPVIS